ncbi:MAG: Crp/Fnr family transcriptional regulator [Xanthomonadales bacterium]|nr:Crp/Fnr family transcriptional regulator [Xanthomonadales bacterium]NNL94257.1 Crp/Fnr family transcriptional regulator [Xanthomonadales bacterium]
MDLRIFNGINLFKSLDEKELQALSEHLLRRHFPKNVVIINEGDMTNSLYIILSGRVKVFLNDENGKEVILNVVEAGDYFGEVSLFDDGRRSASIMTLVDSEFAVLEKSSFLTCMKSSPELALTIIRGLTERLRGLSANVRNLALMDVYGRVAHTLIELAEDQDGTTMIPGGITYKELAQRVGASSKMVGRVMKDLRTGGYISKLGHNLVINRSFPSSW